MSLVLSSMSASSSLQSLSMDVNYDFVNLDPKYKCVKCQMPLRIPMQTPCGHRMCRSCVEELFSSSSEDNRGIPCPAAEEGCEEIDRDKVYPDFSAAREMKQQKVFCIYKQYGCQETPMLGKLKEHIEHCTSVRECQYCHRQLPPDELENHIKNLCPDAVIACEYNCDVRHQPRRQMEEHYRECRNRPRPCKYHPMGCKIQLAEAEMTEHEADSALHLELLTVHVSMLELENSQLKRRLESVREEMDVVNSKLSTCLKENDDLKRHVATLQDNLQLLNERQNQTAATLNSKIAKVENSSLSLEERSQEYVQLRAKCTELEARVRDLTTNPQSGNAALPEDVRKQFIMHDRTIGLHDVRLSEIDLRLQCTETANYEGVLIWKIGEYRQRKLQAVGGRVLSLYSQPFYTSRYGYKMCARVYLNGDGVGRSNYLSLFFVVMQGDYDEILSWPFRQKVTLTLIDQKQNRRHLSDTFRPDPTSTSFQKPTSPMNVASGCPMFVEHKVLEDEREGLYLQKDTIFIKVVVDTSDLMNP